MDQLLDQVSLYWFTGTINSSMRLYYEALGPRREALPMLAAPLGYTVYPAEIYSAPRAWAESAFPTLSYWNTQPRGGHFAAMEEPDLFVADIGRSPRTSSRPDSYESGSAVRA